LATTIKERGGKKGGQRGKTTDLRGVRKKTSRIRHLRLGRRTENRQIKVGRLRKIKEEVEKNNRLATQKPPKHSRPGKLGAKCLQNAGVGEKSKKGGVWGKKIPAGGDPEGGCQKSKKTRSKYTKSETRQNKKKHTWGEIISKRGTGKKKKKNTWEQSSPT